MKTICLLLGLTLGLLAQHGYTARLQRQHAKDPLAAVVVFACEQYKGTVIITRDGTAIPLDVLKFTKEEAAAAIDPLFKSGHVGAVDPCVMTPEPIPHDFPGEPGTDKTKI